MLLLPKEQLDAAVCAVVFQRIWQRVLELVMGAILAPGKRTVSAILRVMGLHEQPHFQNYYRVLSRRFGQPQSQSNLVTSFDSSVCTNRSAGNGADDTSVAEGSELPPRGSIVQFAPDSHLVKASGLRWLSLMLLVPIPGHSGSGHYRFCLTTTLPRTAKSSTQAAGLGQTNDKASAAMVAEANDGCGCR